MKNKKIDIKRIRNLPVLFIKKLLIVIFLPLYLFIFKVLKGKDKLVVKIFKSIGIFLFIIPLSLIINAFVVILMLLFSVFVIGIKMPSSIIGESMLPTLINNQLFFAHPYNNWIFWEQKIGRGDIIIFQDNKTDGKAFVKRVIGIPGDEIELRNGFVYINGKILNEPYVNNYRATYGGSFLSECKKIKVPNNYVFALGDNRLRSKDSREIGFVPEPTIEKILHFDEQGLLKERWKRNEKVDITKTLLSTDEYIKMINELRRKNNLKPLSLDSKLSKSSLLRANMMLKFNDLSWNATQSGYPMSKSMQDAGYYNITYGEYPVLGYYSADDLYKYIDEVKNSKDFFLNKDYQDIGIASVIGNLNNCPVQLVEQQVAGYVPPNYSQSIIEGWQEALDSLRQNQTGWQNLKQNSYFYGKYKTDIDRINEIISIRILNMDSVVTSMRANKWLSLALDAYTKTGDRALFNEQESIAKKLNSSK